MVNAVQEKLYCLEFHQIIFLLLVSWDQQCLKNEITGLAIQKVGNNLSRLYNAPNCIILYCIVYLLLSEVHIDRVIFYHNECMKLDHFMVHLLMEGWGLGGGGDNSNVII